MHWYFLQEMHFLVLLITVHEMPCIVIPSFLILLITVHEMPCIVIPRLLITVHEMPCIVIPRLLILLITVHEMPCIVIPSFLILITVHEMPCIVIPRLLILLIIILCTKLLRLIQLEPLNVETSRSLVKDTSDMYFLFFYTLYFLRYQRKTNKKCPFDLHWAIVTS